MRNQVIYLNENTKWFTPVFLIAFFTIFAAIGGIWGSFVKSPPRPPMTNKLMPVYPGAQEILALDGKPLLTDTLTSSFVNFQFEANASPQAIVAFYNSSLQRIGFYSLNEPPESMSRAFVRENEAEHPQVEKVTIDIKSEGPERASVEIKLAIVSER